jgi:hypothetical protein
MYRGKRYAEPVRSLFHDLHGVLWKVPHYCATYLCNFCLPVAIRERAGHSHRNGPLTVDRTSVISKSSCCLILEVMDVEIDMSDVIQ